MIFPVKGSYTVTAVFGQTGRYWKDGHKGTDFVSDDKNVYAATGGRVRVVAYDPSGWGNYVSVGDKDGYRHLYCHLQSVNVTINRASFGCDTQVIKIIYNIICGHIMFWVGVLKKILSNM